MELAEFLIAKICHDLAGSLGAVNNGVELLRDPESNVHDESIELIELSAKDSVAKLLYFRQAFGVSRATGICMTGIKDLVNNFFSGKNVTFVWPEAHGDSDSMQLLKAEISKILLNLILIVSGTLIYGGKIIVRIKIQKDDVKVKVRGEGKMVKLHDYIADALQKETDSLHIDSKNVQACLTYKLAKKIGGGIVTEIGTTEEGENFIEIIAG